MVYVFLADGFEEVEAITPIDLLRRCAVDVCTVGVTGKQVTGAHGISVIADCTMDACTLHAQDVIVLPGGMPGTKYLFECQPLREMIAQAHANGQWVAAICAAPSIILGGMGLLQGKRATCYPGMEAGMTGAIAVDANCVVEGNIITARGAGAAIDFAVALATVLCDAQTAQDMAKAMCY